MLYQTQHYVVMDTHINHIRTSKSTCVKLIRAVNKHGEDNFTFEILCECSTQEILKTEQSYIDSLNPTYNIAKIAGSNLGIKRTEEVKLKKWYDLSYRWKLI